MKKHSAVLLVVVGLCSVIMLAPAAVPGANEQAVKTFRTRDVVIYYTAEDENGIRDRVLYLTADEGAKWERVATEAVEWKGDDRGRTFVIFHAPADGTYGFAFQFVDNAGKETSAPRPGDKPELIAIVASGPEILRLDDVLESPVRESVVESKTRALKMPYRLKKSREATTKILWATSDGGATWAKASEVEWVESAGATAVLFNAGNDGTFGFTMELGDGKTYRTPAPRPGEKPFIVAVVTTALPLVSIEEILMEPRRGTEIKSREHSARIEYALKEGVVSRDPILWVTADNGATWAKSTDAAWLRGPQDKSSVIFMARADGVYGLSFEFTDGTTYRTASLKAGDRPHLTVAIATSVPVVTLDDILVDPVKGADIRSAKREIRIPYRVKEGYVPTERCLWLTRDGGKSWKKGEGVEWLFDGKGNGYALFTVGADGAYGVAFEFNNPEKFTMAAPQAGEAPRFVVTVDTTQPFLNLADLLESPKSGENLASASWSIRVPYQFKEGAAVATKDLLVTADGGKSWGAAENVEWSCDREGKTFARFTVPADGLYGVTFRLTDANGLATAAPKEPLATVAVTTVKVQAKGRPILLKPTGGEQWTGGKVVVLQWMSTNGVREKSTAISYSIDGGSWTVITKGLENMGFYRWAPPSKATSRLKIRVTMEDAAGNEVASEPSGDITVVVPSNPDIAAAKRHFHRATLLRAQRKYDEAIMSYEEALTAWDQYPDALNDIAYVHYQIGDYGKALEYFLRAREVNRGSPQSNAYVGFALFKLGLPEDSLRELANAVALDAATRALGRDVADELMELARVFQKEGNKEAASRACALILQIPSARTETRRMAQSLATPQ